MKGWITILALGVFGLPACSAVDGVSGGARAQCAAGGELLDCPDAERTSEGACWRMVDCGAIAVSSVDNNGNHRFDWGRCVDGLDGETADRQRLTINCIAASSCDQLRMDGSPNQPNTDQNYCLVLGR